MLNELNNAIRSLHPVSDNVRKAIRKIIRNHPELTDSKYSHIDFMIGERAAWKAKIDAATENGKVGMIVSGMDCDCTKYHSERIVDAPKSIVKWCRDYERHCDYLDGPENTYFVKPSQVRDGYYQSRDLALEAFEDGHPHVVYL